MVVVVVVSRHEVHTYEVHVNMDASGAWKHDIAS